MIKRFLKYVEITTKITSVFAFLLATAYLFYIGQTINWGHTLVFFASMFVFDLTTTAINNYIDTKKDIERLFFKKKAALAIIFVLFAVGAALGLYLAYLTDIVVLLAGGLCFLCGVFYTYGPVPLSRLPLGEAASGLFYGFFIPFLMLYINMPGGTFLSYAISAQSVTVTLNFAPLLTVALLSVIPFTATANIMLANNMCDLEKDIAAGRRTLPYFLGNKSLKLFAGGYYAAYAATIIMAAAGIISPLCLLSLLTIIPVQKNINAFSKRQDKTETFINSIKNYILVVGANVLTIFISFWL